VIAPHTVSVNDNDNCNENNSSKNPIKITRKTSNEIVVNNNGNVLGCGLPYNKSTNTIPIKTLLFGLVYLGPSNMNGIR